MAACGWFRRLLTTRWIADILALLAGIVYLAQSWAYAHTRESILDEGAYLYKGYLFITGQVRIYQDYGAWSNHMPLSFYIPGLTQILAPGLASARYLAIILGLLFIIGIWLVARRVGGRWWAAAAVWVIAINPVLIKMYSVMVTQVLISCMMVWILVLVLGENRRHWQIGLGACLAGLMLLTRLNMAPVLPLLILYTFWRHGQKSGAIALAVGGAIVIVGHMLFWPGILRMWAYWIPNSFFSFLNPWKPPPDTNPYWDPNIDVFSRIASFFMSFRISFLTLAGAIATWIVWPRRNHWRKQGHYRDAIFLSTIFLILWLVHIWATLLKNYCVFCLPGYTTFFYPIGLILLIITLPIWQRHPSRWRQFIAISIILMISAGIGYANFEQYGIVLYSLPVPKSIIGYHVSDETLRLGELVSTIFPVNRSELRRLFPTLVGLIIGSSLLLFAVVVQYLKTCLMTDKSWAFGYVALMIFVLSGTVLTPSQPFSAGYSFYECEGDVMQSYAAAGKHLAQAIPSGSKVYWKGGLSVVPLLYASDISIYLPQINGDYTYYRNGSTDELERYGFWNEELAKKWALEANYILIEQRYYKEWLADLVNSGAYDELNSTPPVVPCRDNSRIRIFRRKF